MERACSFNSYFLGGFECSTHYRADGNRLDLLASTCHDRFPELDYRRLQSVGMRSCRDGVRWHLIERERGWYNYASLLPMLRAAARTGTQCIWDLCHYGYPDWLDVFSPEFIDRFAAFSRATARVVAQETPGPHYFSPVNEISFFSWAGGEVGLISPFEKTRGLELKKQLVRASIASIEAVRDELPSARFVQPDPLIHIVTDEGVPAAVASEAQRYRGAQYQGWDMLAGRVFPELGGHPRYLDIIGVNYYVHNQWVYGGVFIERKDPRYRAFSEMLAELWQRYEKPMFIAETGIEEERRPEWLRYICDEVEDALRAGTPVEGICLYPIVNYPGWDDDRHCHNGLWDYCNDNGYREIYTPLADELARQRERMETLANDLFGEPAAAGVSA